MESPHELRRTRAHEILDQLEAEIYRRTDRLFAVLLPLHWALLSAISLTISQAGGGDTGATLWTTLMLAALVTAVPTTLVLTKPGRPATRHSVAVAQLILSGLLMHVTGGRTEAQFDGFISLMLLALYDDWRVLVTATAVAIIGHLGLPGSFVGYVALIAAEDAALLVICRRATDRMSDTATRTADVEISQDRYRAVVEQTGDAIAVIDARTREVLEHNPAFRRLLGGQPGRLTGLVITDDIMPGDATLDAAIQRLHDTDEPLHDERRLRRFDGTVVDVGGTLNLTAFAGRDAVCLVMQDISRQKHMAAALSAAHDAAIDAARAKSQFLANMSHEIRTPMNGVMNMAALLLETPLSTEQRDFAMTIESSAESLLTIINDILDFSKVESGHLEFETIDFDLCQVVESTADLLAERARQKEIELIACVDPNIPTALRGDPNRLRQVLTNLLANAVKFTHSGEVVLRVSTHSAEGNGVHLRFEVRDTGVGMTGKVRDRLFQPFMQADSSTTRKYGGTGLGLAISHRLVELMGGHFTVTSEPGAGSTFAFTARLERQPVADDAAENTLISRVAQGRHVLVVDDNATHAALAGQLLAHWGFHVETAVDVDAARDALQRAMPPFDLIIVDDSLDPIEDRPAVPTVRMTVRGARVNPIDPSVRASATYVAKPIHRSTLCDAVLQALGITIASRGHQPTEPRATARRVPRTARILVADDNPINQKVAQLQLKSLGYSADIVANGADAIDAAARDAYDLVLMDCEMPDVDGYEATKAIRDLKPRRPLIIVAMTAHAMKGDRDRCLAAGMDDYIAKPLRKPELERILAEWLPAGVAEKR